jgi:hypothetical protein
VDPAIVIALVFGLLVILSFVRVVWRLVQMVRHNEQPDAAGSFGRQMFGRRDQKPDRD